MDKDKRAIAIGIGILFILPMVWGMHWLATHEAGRAHWWVAIICFALSLARVSWKTIKAFCGTE